MPEWTELKFRIQIRNESKSGEKMKFQKAIYVLIPVAMGMIFLFSISPKASSSSGEEVITRSQQDIATRLKVLEEWKGRAEERIARLEAHLGASGESLGDGARSKLVESGNDPAVGVVREYRSAKRWEDRLKWCWNGKQLRGEFGEYYRNRVFSPDPSEKLKVVPVFDLRYKSNGISMVELVGTDVIYFLRETPEGPRIDWGASTELCEIKIDSIKTEPVPSPVMLRCLVKKGNFFHGNYRGLQGTYDNYTIARTGSVVTQTAYVEKNSRTGRALNRIAQKKPGEFSAVMIKVVTGGKDRIGKDISIVEFLNAGWFEGINIE